MHQYRSVYPGEIFVLTGDVVGLDATGGCPHAIHLLPGAAVKVIDYPCQEDDRLARVDFESHNVLLPVRDLRYRGRKVPRIDSTHTEPRATPRLH